jgi:hypothetical protein
MSFQHSRAELLALLDSTYVPKLMIKVERSRALMGGGGQLGK